MKTSRYIIVILFFLLPFSSSAQDIIILKSGKEIKAKIIKVGDTEIEYKKEENPGGPVYAVSKDEVVSFEYNKAAKTLQSTTDAEKLLQGQTKRDELYLEALRKQQEQLNTQVQNLSSDVSRLVNKWQEQDTEYKNNLKKQQEEIRKQQEQLNQQVNQIASNVSQMSNAVSNINTVGQEKQWNPKPLGFGILMRGLLAQKENLVFILSLTPGSHFRIESEFAAILTSGGTSAYYFSAGFLGMWQYGKTNGYAGLRIMSFGVGYDNSTTSLLYLAPSIGAEYAFATHFTIGSEIRFPFIFSVQDKSAGLGIASNHIILRFYIGRGKDSKTNTGTTTSSTYTPQPEYSAPSPIPPVVSYPCSSVKYGKFKMRVYTIIRQEDTQRQYKNGVYERDYKVVWVSDCEYHLTPNDNPNKKNIITITSVDKNGYNCNVTYTDGKGGKTTSTARIDKVQ